MSILSERRHGGDHHREQEDKIGFRCQHNRCSEPRKRWADFRQPLSSQHSNKPPNMMTAMKRSPNRLIRLVNFASKNCEVVSDAASEEVLIRVPGQGWRPVESKGVSQLAGDCFRIDWRGGPWRRTERCDFERFGVGGRTAQDLSPSCRPEPKHRPVHTRRWKGRPHQCRGLEGNRQTPCGVSDEKGHGPVTHTEARWKH